MAMSSGTLSFFLLALEADADLADAYGQGADARRWRESATKLRRRIREVFWQEESRRFATYAGVPDCRKVHELTQALAILADIVPQCESLVLAERLSVPSEWVEPSLSQSIYKFDALVKTGPLYERKAVEMMDETWGAMLKAGATSFWEMKEGWQAFDNAGSLCHGWSAIPIYLYARYLGLMR